MDSVIKTLSLFLLCVLLLIKAGAASASEAGVDMDCYNRCMSYIINGTECARRCDNARPEQQRERKLERRVKGGHEVVGIIDGETLILVGNIRVRLIGVDIPGARHRPSDTAPHFGKEARDFTTKMVEGKKVRLEYDARRKDEHGWALAYVYLLDGTLLNAEIIKRGYGRVDMNHPFRYSNEFKEYERNARENKRGMWE